LTLLWRDQKRARTGLPAGFDMRDLKKAKALLEELAA
jgi:hypothetical protein